MFREGFTLSETAEFDNPTVKLFSIPAENVPCISISQIPASVNKSDGQNNKDYCAYTFYIRNEGSTTVSYEWELIFTAEDRNVSSGMWAIVIEDEVMRIYAKANTETGLQEAVPAFGDDSRGYRFLGIRDLAPDSDQFQLIKSSGSATWWRVVPDRFLDDGVIAAGEVVDVAPREIHKYTVVLWIEGDDPDATDELINGHAGVAMQFRMQNEKDGADGTGVRWADLWDDLRFWQD